MITTSSTAVSVEDACAPLALSPAQPCLHCKEPLSDHAAQGQCLWTPTRFEAAPPYLFDVLLTGSSAYTLNLGLGTSTGVGPSTYRF